MQKIDRDRLDENTGQIECGEEIGTVFLIDKETAITVKHCLLIEKPETYAKNAVLHFSVKDEEKTVNATVISEDNDAQRIWLYYDAKRVLMFSLFICLVQN